LSHTALPIRATEAAEVPADTGSLSLTFKGLVACLLLILYAGVMAAYILAERQLLAGRQSAMDELLAMDEAFKRAGLAASNALMPLRLRLLDGDTITAAKEMTPYALEAIEQSFRPWRDRFPGLVAQYDQAQRRLATLAAQPTLANLIELREALEALGRELHGQATRATDARRALQGEYRRHGDRITLTALTLGLGGLLVFGGVSALFFARAASDLLALGARAGEVVAGYRGEPLAVRRRDEIGALARAVNRLQADLARRERELDEARELRAHREKMAALGAMARNLSHEIGNPLATISAIVQNLDGAQLSEACRACQPEVILEQTRRIAQITRQIAEFAGPRADAAQPLDAGAMLTAVCEFMRFDPRFKTTRLEARISASLPPLVAVPDELSEVLMNLLQLCVDGAAAQKPQRIAIEALAADEGVVIRAGGAVAPGETARRDRTRRLVEGMGGRMSEGGDGTHGYEIALPAAPLAAPDKA
jgi:C4-dicarboxylate-specific signal transduction histidine kinase